MDQKELINELEALNIYVQSMNVSASFHEYNTIHIDGYMKKETNMNTILRTQADVLSAVRAKEYIIASVSVNGDFSIAESPAVHDSGTGVRTEAKRLAKLSPGKAFVILTLAGAEMVPVNTVSI